MAQWRKDSQSFLDHNKTIFEVVNIGDKDGNIINTFGAASNVPIAAGLVNGYSGVHKCTIYSCKVNRTYSCWCYTS